MLSRTSPSVYEFDASRSRFAYAWRDARTAFSNPHLIATIIRQDAAARTRGAALGGFWVMLTTLATVSGLALLYGKLFGADLTTYFPYVAFGIIAWGLISGLANDGVNAFAGGGMFIQQTSLPKTLLAIKAMSRSITALGYKLVVIVGIIIVGGLSPGVGEALLSVLGLATIIWTGFFLCLALGTISARFRDIGQFVDVGLTFAFFATPVFWHPDRLGEYAKYVLYNPFYHYLNIVRGPLVGAEDVGLSFMIAFFLTALVTVFGVFVFGRFSHRLPYWC
ncbi:MAG: ABC transporter permease [Parvularculaceae bacterium]|nr:ABC transporter permease [Parvularculaceae bacterium]